MKKPKRDWLLRLALGVASLLTACAPAPVLPTAAPIAIATSAPLPSPVPSEQNAEPIAFLLRVEGNVWLVESTDSGRGPGLMALSPSVLQQTNPQPQPFRRLPGGTTLRLEAGGAVVIVCYNDRVYRVEGPDTITVTQERCESGKNLPTGSAKRMTPNQGRIHTLDGSRVLEGELRGDDEEDFSVPLILSPRNSRLLDLEPTIVWRAVTNTLEYRFDLLATNNYATVAVKSAEIACVSPEDGTVSPVCTIPWPPSWPLTHEQRLFLTVSARQPNGSTTQSEASELHTFSLEERGRIETEIAEIEALGLDPTSQALLLASLYAQENLHTEGITAYQTAQAQQPSSPVAIALGDLYLAVSLPGHALAAYAEAFDLLAREGESDPVYSAASELGVGLAHLYRAEYETAIEHLTTALHFYRQAGATEEEALAVAALEKAGKGNSSD